MRICVKQAEHALFVSSPMHTLTHVSRILNRLQTQHISQDYILCDQQHSSSTADAALFSTLPSELLLAQLQSISYEVPNAL